MLIFNMNRSSCESGREKVPNCSELFWVAMTKNGRSRG